MRIKTLKLGVEHVKKTGDIELIKITKTKRIQDGVVRLEFVSGPNAFEYEKQQEQESKRKAEEAVAKEQLEKQREETNLKLEKRFQFYWKKFC